MPLVLVVAGRSTKGVVVSEKNILSKEYGYGRKSHESNWKMDILKMEMWDEEYINMEVQAYIEIAADNIGSFQFGLVSAEFKGKMLIDKGQERFEFTFKGNDECEEVSGKGWMRIKENDLAEGEFKFHDGDDSTFLARKIK
jgi:hypothetical protein